jgi:two-component system chemotaxis response regulator CheB
MIRLLIVDDSALMRRLLSAMFSDEPEFEVRTARNGREAIEQNLAFEPHVITLDINMPEMDGLTALSHLMVQRPVPVVMLSSLTEKGALATFEALNLGAVDYLPKPDGTISLSIDTLRDAIIAKVRAAAGARLTQGRATPSLRPARLPRAARTRPAAEPAMSVVPGDAGNDGLLLIGASTGGPRTLETVLCGLPADFPWPVVVAQHMPASFTGPFAQRLDGVCALRVVEVSSLQMLRPGTVYIGRGAADLQLVRRLSGLGVTSRPENPSYLWHPSVELLGRSALQHIDAARLIGVMLTGMGHDGAEAFAEIHARGGRTIAESEASAVVFGMPAELIRRGGAQCVLPAQEIAAQLLEWIGTVPDAAAANTTTSASTTPTTNQVRA